MSRMQPNAYSSSVHHACQAERDVLKFNKLNLNPPDPPIETGTILYIINTPSEI